MKRNDQDTAPGAAPEAPATAEDPTAETGQEALSLAKATEDRRATSEERRANRRRAAEASATAGGPTAEAGQESLSLVKATEDRRATYEERRANRRRIAEARRTEPQPIEDDDPSQRLPSIDDPFGDTVEAKAAPTRPLSRGPLQLTSARRRSSWWLNLTVMLLPAIIAAIYLFGFASNIYQVDSVFMVRNPAAAGGGGGGGGILAAITGGGGGGGTRAIDESYAVIRYIQSREAFEQMEKRLKLREHYSQPQYSWFQRLHESAGFERFYRYYLGNVDIHYDDLEGKVMLSTYAFDPKLALDFNRAIIAISEELVNTFNERALNDSIATARANAEKAEKALNNASDELTKFQLENQVIDPQSSSSAVFGIISTLEAQAATTQAEIRALTTMSGGNAPKLAELRNRLTGLFAQISAEQTRLTGRTNALAPVMQRYNMLSMGRQIAQQFYTTALQTLESTIITAQRQKLYVVNVVNPDFPPEPRHPRRLFILGITLAVSFVVCLIMRLVIAAIRDHMV